MPRILFVCTGNLCRSPMAEVLLTDRIQRRGLDGWTVKSAGTWTPGGAPASRYAIEVMSARGLDLSEHRSRAVDSQSLQEADLVLVMTRSHAEALRLEFPEYSKKVYLVSEMAEGATFDVRDPYGGPRQEYEACADLIAALIDFGFERIYELVHAASDYTDTKMKPADSRHESM